MFSYDDTTGKFKQTLVDFSGALNTRDIDSVLKENEVSSIRNFTYDKLGALKVRAGFKRVNSTAIDTNPIKSIGGYYPESGTYKAIFSSKTSIYSLQGSTVSTIKTGLSGDSKKFCFHQFMDNCYMANGADSIQVYDGSSVWAAGYTAPASAPSMAEGATGVLEAGTYKGKVTFLYSDGESNPCTDEATVTIQASKKINWSAIPTGDSRCIGRRLWRTTKDGATFKLLTAINDNTATTYEDNVPDSGLGADLEYDNNAPSVCKYIINHKSRLWFAGDPDYPSRVWYSKALHPEAVPETYYWDIGLGDGDEITGIAVNLDALVIFKKYSTWIISGDLPTGTSADMKLENVNPTVGCVSYWTEAHAGNELIFLTASVGVQRLHRVILASTETMDVEPLSYKITPTIDNLNGNYLIDSHAIVYNHKYYLFAANGTSTSPDICLVLDLRNLDPDNEESIKWTIYDNYNFNCSTLFRDSSGEHAYTGGTGLVYEIEQGTNDDGALINANMTTKYLELGDFYNEKIPRLLLVLGRASEDYQFTVRVFSLWRGAEYQDEFTFSGGGVTPSKDVLYGENLYGQLLYAVDGGFTATVLDIFKSKLITRPVNKIKFKLDNVRANQEFALYGFELEGLMGTGKQIK